MALGVVASAAMGTLVIALAILAFAVLLLPPLWFVLFRSAPASQEEALLGPLSTSPQSRTTSTPSRRILGALLLAALVGGYTAWDSSSILRGGVAVAVSLVPMLAMLWLFQRDTPKSSAIAVGILCAAFVTVPLAVGGKMPRSRGISQPAPGPLGLVLIGVGAFMFGVGITWFVRWRQARRSEPNG